MRVVSKGKREADVERNTPATRLPPTRVSDKERILTHHRPLILKSVTSTNFMSEQFLRCPRHRVVITVHKWKTAGVLGLTVLQLTNP